MYDFSALAILAILRVDCFIIWYQKMVPRVSAESSTLKYDTLLVSSFGHFSIEYCHLQS